MRVYLTQEIVNEIWKILSEEGKESYSLTIWSNYPDKLIRRSSLFFGIHQHELQDSLILLVMGNQANLCSQKQICLPEDSSGLFSQNWYVWRPFSLNTMGFKGVNTSEVTDMSQMFLNCHVSKLCLGGFDTSNVTDMSYMFLDCEAKYMDLSSFDTGNVTNMSSMFASCKADMIGLDRFDTSKVTNMEGMFDFYRNPMADLNLSSWDTSSVTNMGAMFRHCQIASLNLEDWNISHAEDMSFMFHECSVQKLDVDVFFALSALEYEGNKTSFFLENMFLETK